jgi:hypothetical protein
MMKILSFLKNTRTSKRRLVLLGSALVLLAGFVLGGPKLLGAAGGGAGWVVRQVVHRVAYRHTAPESEEPATLTTRVRVASSTGLPELVPGEAAGSPAPEAAEGEDAAARDSVEALPPVDLVTPLDEEAYPREKDEPPYRSFGLRDPMMPLVTPDGDPDEEMQFSVYRLQLVGVAWRAGERVGLLEDPARKSYLFRVGEYTKDGGRVVEITENSITFTHVRYGELTRFTLRLMPREEDQ